METPRATHIVPNHGRPPLLSRQTNQPMSHQPTQAAHAPTASALASAASVTVSAAVAVRSGAQSIANFAGTKLSFMNPPTRKPKHPDWTTRSCICNRQSECKKIMREWEKLGADYAHMLDYAFIPPIPKKRLMISGNTRTAIARRASSISLVAASTLKSSRTGWTRGKTASQLQFITSNHVLEKLW